MKKHVLMLVSGSLLLMTAATSCKKNDSSLPPIGGYNSSDEVAKSSLKAHWTFDDTPNEAISGAAPTTTKNVSYVTGVKGKAARFASGLLAFNEIAALNTMPSFTVTSWVNVANNKGGLNSTSCIFSLTRPATAGVEEWAGNINLLFETAQFPSTSDTLRPKILIVPKVNGTPSFQDNINDPTLGGDQVVKGQNTWIFVAAEWDASTSKLTVWVNGKKVSNPAWEDRKDAGGNPIGALSFFTPTRVVIGGYATTAWGTPDTWQQPLVGQIDELRIYSSALSQADMTALMQLEQAGR